MTRRCEKCEGWLRVKNSTRKGSIQLQTMECTDCGHTFSRAVDAGEVRRRKSRKLRDESPVQREQSCIMT